MGLKSTIIDYGNARISVGEFAGFKDDIEMSGRVVEIPNASTLVVSVYDSVTGDRENRTINAYTAWKE